MKERKTIRDANRIQKKKEIKEGKIQNKSFSGCHYDITKKKKKTKNNSESHQDITPRRKTKANNKCLFYP